ncbi:MAG TPA: hypothetical protein VI700_01670 [Thermoanaerobaculaceae bacterium]|nr:hypothetical protein [Thermoanaerobaculaceae bacterium]
MAPLTSASVLATRFLEPLTHPWAVVGGGLAGGGALWADTLVHGIRLAFRLLGLLLSL